MKLHTCKNNVEAINIEQHANFYCESEKESSIASLLHFFVVKFFMILISLSLFFITLYIFAEKEEKRYSKQMTWIIEFEMLHLK
jgi:hypothetical protein